MLLSKGYENIHQYLLVFYHAELDRLRKPAHDCATSRDGPLIREGGVLA
jgi:hypothetical protein